MKIVSVYNIAPIYRKGIFNLLDRNYSCDWFFGEAQSGIKQMKPEDFLGKVTIVENSKILGGKAYWQKRVIRCVFKPYTHYLFLGDERCISTWISILILRFMPHKKVYFWSHGVYGRESIFKQMIQKVFYSLVDGTFLYGNYARNLMIKRGYKSDELFVVHNSLDYDHQMQLRTSVLPSGLYEKHFGNNHPVIIMIGRLNRRKNLDFLIDAVNNLRTKRLLVNVVFIGDGEDRDVLERKVCTLGLTDQFWFYGSCYNEKENAGLISNADLCVVPGDIGLTAIHSLMYGVPVITHNCFKFQGPEFEAITPGITGDFYEYGSVESLTLTIQNWFCKVVSREEIRRACYSEVDHNWTPMFQYSVFNSVIK